VKAVLGRKRFWDFQNYFQPSNFTTTKTFDSSPPERLIHVAKKIFFERTCIVARITRDKM
jgi:hypothetical protein